MAAIPIELQVSIKANKSDIGNLTSNGISGDINSDINKKIGGFNLVQEANKLMDLATIVIPNLIMKTLISLPTMAIAIVGVGTVIVTELLKKFIPDSTKFMDLFNLTPKVDLEQSFKDTLGIKDEGDISKEVETIQERINNKIGSTETPTIKIESDLKDITIDTKIPEVVTVKVDLDQNAFGAIQVKDMFQGSFDYMNNNKSTEKPFVSEDKKTLFGVESGSIGASMTGQGYNMTTGSPFMFGIGGSKPGVKLEFDEESSSQADQMLKNMATMISDNNDMVLNSHKDQQDQIVITKDKYQELNETIERANSAQKAFFDQKISSLNAAASAYERMAAARDRAGSSGGGSGGASYDTSGANGQQLSDQARAITGAQVSYAPTAAAAIIAWNNATTGNNLMSSAPKNYSSVSTARWG